MTNEELAAIRARNEERKRALPDGAIITSANEEAFDEAHSDCEEDIDALLAEVERLTKCDGCGKPRSLGVCSGYCDNDE